MFKKSATWLGVSLCVIGSLPWNPGRFMLQLSMGLIFAGVMIGWHLRKHFDWSVALAFTYVWVSGVIYFRWPTYFFGIFTPFTQEMFIGIVRESVLWLLACTFLGYIAVRKDRFWNHNMPTFERSLHFVFWGQIIHLCISRLLDAHLLAHFLGHWIVYWIDSVRSPLVQGRWLGMCDNEAIDACLLLCLYPIVLIKEKSVWWKHAIVCFMIFASGSSTAMGAYAVLLATCVLVRHYFDWRTIFAAILVMFLVGLVGYERVGWMELISASGRVHIWQISMEYFYKFAPHWTGVGVGSFLLYGPGIQLQGHGPGEIKQIFIWMHSEPLQILFELGYVGLGLTLVMFGRMIWRSFKALKYSGNPWMLMACLTFFITDLSQMHLRFSIPTAVGIFLVSYVLGREDNQWINHS